MKNQSELDTNLLIVENQVRRRIIRRLSQEPSYPLELAKELGIGQQLVTSHLEIMERNGILGSSTEKSPKGPIRRRYFLKKSVYLTVGFGPNLYKEQMLSFDSLPTDLSKDHKKFINKIGDIQKSSRITSDKITSFSDLIEEIDTKLNDFEAKKAVLLYIRNLAMGCACEVMAGTEKTADERRVLHYIINERNTDVEAISLALNLRESIIRGILKNLKKELPEV
jgi:predicted transcriptional regulator